MQPLHPSEPRRTIPGDWAHHLWVGLTVGLASLLPTNLLGLALAPNRETSDSHILLRTLMGQGWDYLFPIILAPSVAPTPVSILNRSTALTAQTKPGPASVSVAGSTAGVGEVGLSAGRRLETSSGVWMR